MKVRLNRWPAIEVASSLRSGSSLVKPHRNASAVSRERLPRETRFARSKEASDDASTERSEQRSTIERHAEQEKH